MGTVYLAEDGQLERLVALKVPRFPDDDCDVVPRFYREAKAAATISHPNLCTVHDAGEVDGTHYLTMEYIEGRPLADFLHTSRPLTERQTALIVRKLASALHEAHQKGVVHRDLKPSNVMINHRNEPVITDFGLALRPGSGDTRLTQSGAMVGTPSYMSPEQVQGNGDAVGPGSDIFSLGVILYEMLCGRLPFEGSMASVLGQIAHDDPVPPSQYREGIDRRLEALCLRMLAKEVGDRPASMQAVADDVTRYLRDTQGTADERRPPSKPGRCDYVTPYGKYAGRRQPDGRWIVGCQLPTWSDPDSLEGLLRTAHAASKNGSCPGIARVAGFSADKRQVKFELDAGVEPLAARDLPLSDHEARCVVRDTAGALTQWHAAGLAAFDLAPECIYTSADGQRTIIVPSPWLADLVRQRPGGSAAMACVAPEVGQAGDQTESARSDVFALGCLAWLLLTGRPRSNGSTELPSESAPELSEWDALIDGCLRTTAQRRFQTMGEAVSVVPAAHYAPQPAVAATASMPPPLPGDQFPMPPGFDSPQPEFPQPARRRPWKLYFAGAGALAMAVLLAVAWSQVSTLISSSHGVGDAVVHYADRDYEGVQWVRVQEARGLGHLFQTVVDASAGNLVPELGGITGIDNDNYWVAGRLYSGGYQATIFQRHNGQWSLAARMDLGRYGQYPEMRALDPGTLVYGAHDRSRAEGDGSAHPNAYIIRSSGTTAFDLTPKDQNYLTGMAVCPIAPDMFYVMTRDAPLRITGDEMLRLRSELDPEFYVHDPDDNAPLRHPVADITYTSAFDEDEAYGLWTRRLTRDSPYGAKPMVVRHDPNGTWYRMSEIPLDQHGWIRSVWFGQSGDGVFCVMAGIGGTVYVHHVDGKTVNQSVNVGLEAATGNLRAVWGISPERYWVVDNCGAVWERSDNEWRKIVGGMLRDDVEFEDVWVSPSGDVFGVTSDAVYQLGTDAAAD